MTHYLFYDAVLGTDTGPTLRDRVNASFGLARSLTWLTIDNGDSPYTALDTADVIDADATSGAITLNLKATPTTGDVYVVRKSDASGNAVTVQGNGKNINGAASSALSSQYDTLRVSYNGTEWAVL